MIIIITIDINYDKNYHCSITYIINAPGSMIIMILRTRIMIIIIIVVSFVLPILSNIGIEVHIKIKNDDEDDDHHDDD